MNTENSLSDNTIIPFKQCSHNPKVSQTLKVVEPLGLHPRWYDWFYEWCSNKCSKGLNIHNSFLYKLTPQHQSRSVQSWRSKWWCEKTQFEFLTVEHKGQERNKPVRHGTGETGSHQWFVTEKLLRKTPEWEIFTEKIFLSRKEGLID